MLAKGERVVEEGRASEAGEKLSIPGGDEERAAATVIRLEESDFLRKLLGTELGLKWLKGHDTRKQVIEFLQAQRKEPPPPERHSEALVREAMVFYEMGLTDQALRRMREALRASGFEPGLVNRIRVFFEERGEQGLLADMMREED